jgi:8-oxo-dGTP pyrophosphatase MutT (NUDIX family)
VVCVAEQSKPRYAGEFKFAGGTRDPNETLEETAVRELREEFAVSVELSQARLRLFNVKQTKPVRNKYAWRLRSSCTLAPFLRYHTASYTISPP